MRLACLGLLASILPLASSVASIHAQSVSEPDVVSEEPQAIESADEVPLTSEEPLPLESEVQPLDDLTATCPAPPQDAEPELSAIAHQAVQVATWLETPESGLGSLVQQVGPQLMAYLSPSPWPTIHERARLAQVPIMMYHDILPEKEVFFDVTPEEFEQDLQYIQANGLTPISMDQLVNHLRTGLPLPEKPILLTFDDGYRGHYTYVYPLLKKYGYPGLFSIYTFKVGREHGRPSIDWAQLREMAADPRVTIAAHSVNHPRDLRELSDADLTLEVTESRRVLEEELGIPIQYFSYPEGKYDERVAWEVRKAGFVAAITMNDDENRFAGESQNLLAIDRIGQSQLETVATQAWGGPQPRPWSSTFDFKAPIRMSKPVVDEVPLTLVTGGKPMTIHADSRYQVSEIIAGTDVAAAVDGGFFSMKYLDSNTMIGPVYSQHTGQFVPGNSIENQKLRGRPLIMISPDEVKFIPFDPAKHNTLAGVQAEMADVTDAFIGAAWLVKNGQPSLPGAFLGFFDFDADRHRAFWGINQAGQPTIGVTNSRVDSVSLGRILAQLGLQDAVMLDSGASTSLAYRGELMVDYTPRPVPHVVGLVPLSQDTSANCPVAQAPDPE